MSAVDFIRPLYPLSSEIVDKKVVATLTEIANKKSKVLRKLQEEMLRDVLEMRRDQSERIHDKSEKKSTEVRCANRLARRIRRKMRSENRQQRQDIRNNLH